MTWSAGSSRQMDSPQVASSLFLQHNTALVPPYRVLIDTNFINFSLQNKLELISGMMDCLYAKCKSYRATRLRTFVARACPHDETAFTS